MKKVHLLMLVISIFAFASCSSSNDNPEEIVKKYMKNVKSEDFNKAVQYFDTEGANKEDIELIVAKLKAGYKETSGIKNFEVTDANIDEESGNATVGVKITYQDDVVEEQNFKLKKDEKGDWKIDPTSK